MSAIALDPLIAEAKRRARRRRLLAAVALAAVGVAIWATLPSGRPQVAGGNGAQSLAPRLAINGFGVESAKRWFISAVSSSGLWISTNAARTWRLAKAPGIHGRYPMSQYAGDDFIDPAHGWVVVYAGDKRIQIDRTTDGGGTWRVSDVPAGPAGTFPSIHFRTRLNGYLDISGGQPVVRFVTTDGGATWTPKSDGTRLLYRRHGFKVFFSPGPGEPVGTLMQTNDHGRHWSRVPLPGDRAVSFVSTFGSVVIAPGHYGRWGGLGAYVSEDAGRSWTLRLAPRQINPGVPQFNVSVPAPGAWYALSADSALRTTLWATHDEGRTWHVVPASGAQLAWGTEPISFVTARLGWALGGGRHGMTLLRTTDGGGHWTPAGPRLKDKRA